MKIIRETRYHVIVKGSEPAMDSAIEQTKENIK